MGFARAEMEEMVERWLAANAACEEALDWTPMADFYTPDATYGWNVGPKDEFMAVGRDEIRDLALGPLISAKQKMRVEEFIRAGRSRGAELIASGKIVEDAPAAGHYVAPQLYAGVTPADPLAQEEIFGPVLTVVPFEDEADALRIANDVDYGLHAGVYSADRDRAVKVARRIEAGQVDINGPQFNIKAPFGGYKQSGLGREYGTYGLEEFLEVKSLQIPLG